MSFSWSWKHILLHLRYYYYAGRKIIYVLIYSISQCTHNWSMSSCRCVNPVPPWRCCVDVTMAARNESYPTSRSRSGKTQARGNTVSVKFLNSDYRQHKWMILFFKSDLSISIGMYIHSVVSISWWEEKYKINICWFYIKILFGLDQFSVFLVS